MLRNVEPEITVSHRSLTLFIKGDLLLIFDFLFIIIVYWLIQFCNTFPSPVSSTSETQLMNFNQTDKQKTHNLFYSLFRLQFSLSLSFISSLGDFTQPHLWNRLSLPVSVHEWTPILYLIWSSLSWCDFTQQSHSLIHTLQSFSLQLHMSVSHFSHPSSVHNLTIPFPTDSTYSSV